MGSLGINSVMALARVRPPIPLSKIPMGELFGIDNKLRTKNVNLELFSNPRNHFYKMPIFVFVFQK